MMSRTTFKFDLDDNVMSLKDMLHGCLGLRKKDIRDISIREWTDTWSTYVVILNKKLTEKELAYEFDGCLAVKNMYLDGQLIESDVDSVAEMYTRFPMLDKPTAKSPTPNISATLPLLYTLLKESSLMIGNATTGSVVQVTGFGPADDGESVLLYGDF